MQSQVVEDKKAEGDLLDLWGKKHCSLVRVPIMMTPKKTCPSFTSSGALEGCYPYHRGKKISRVKNDSPPAKEPASDTTTRYSIFRCYFST